MVMAVRCLHRPSSKISTDELPLWIVQESGVKLVAGGGQSTGVEPSLGRKILIFIICRNILNLIIGHLELIYISSQNRGCSSHPKLG